MLRRLIAAFFVAHGVAHLVGFSGSWRLGEFADAPYTTAILNGAVDVGDAGIRVVGILWVAAAVAFGGAAVLLWRGSPMALRATALVTAFSLAICVVGLPAAVVGVVIDVAILVALAATSVFRPATIREVAR